jgi:hypothetical protein
MPYFSYMCLVDKVEGGKVYFNHTVGCDQGGPTPHQPGKAWDWCVVSPSDICTCHSLYPPPPPSQHPFPLCLAVVHHVRCSLPQTHARAHRYIENVLEECDSPGEYFYDAEEEALYYTFNGTDTPTKNSGDPFALTRTKVCCALSDLQLHSRMNTIGIHNIAVV